MSLSKVQRQTLLNQHKILALLDKDEADYHNRMVKAFEYGFVNEYADNERLSEEMSQDDCNSVWKALSLYEALQNSWDRLTDKDGISQSRVTYIGFDGNNETSLMSYSRFIVEDLGRFNYLRISDHNSHMPMAQKYARMHENYKEIGYSQEMTADQIRQILEIS